MTVTVQDLPDILASHREWALGDANGKRANLYGADLRGADLREADLSRANLSGADLRWADLSGVAFTLPVGCFGRILTNL